MRPLARFSNLVTMVTDTHGMAGVGKENWCKLWTNWMSEWSVMEWHALVLFVNLK